MVNLIESKDGSSYMGVMANKSGDVVQTTGAQPGYCSPKKRTILERIKIARKRDN